MKAVAHEDKKRLGIGIELTDKGSKTAIIDGKVYSSQFDYKTEKSPKIITVQDVLVPVIVDGEQIGAINLALFLFETSKYGIKSIPPKQIFERLQVPYKNFNYRSVILCISKISICLLLIFISFFSCNLFNSL